MACDVGQGLSRLRNFNVTLSSVEVVQSGKDPSRLEWFGGQLIDNSYNTRPFDFSHSCCIERCRAHPLYLELILNQGASLTVVWWTFFGIGTVQIEPLVLLSSSTLLVWPGQCFLSNSSYISFGFISYFYDLELLNFFFSLSSEAAQFTKHIAKNLHFMKMNQIYISFWKK